MTMSAGDMYRLAADLASEHGDYALHYARRAVLSFEAEGATDRAHFWFMLTILLDDIVAHRVDPDAEITLH